MKRLLTILLAAVLVVGVFAACGQQTPAPAGGTAPGGDAASADDEVVIAFILSAIDDWNQHYLNTGIAKAESLGFRAIGMNPEGDITRQIDFVQSAIAQGVDMIAIQPLDTAALAPILRRAHEAGIYVNSVYQIEPEFEEDLDFIIFTIFGQFESGQMAARALVDEIGGSGEIAIIAGAAGASNTVLRSEGFRSVIEQYPGITIVNEVAAFWDRSRAMGVALDMMTSNPDLVGIFSMGDQMAHGIIEAVESQGMSDQISIVTVDAGSATQQAVLDGRLAAAVTVPPNWFSETAVEILYKLVNGQPIEEYYIYMPEIVTRENADPASVPF